MHTFFISITLYSNLLVPNFTYQCKLAIFNHNATLVKNVQGMHEVITMSKDAKLVRKKLKERSQSAISKAKLSFLKEYTKAA
ncbi:hypothetical protein ABT56_18105 [Photobacterium aquae]|uniref:Uncharacterized protein n=1 Tax=Photobacterium aquae TaxID=1195763 RepID=A0A0J1GVL4_9GAMM|nr:hypothetical protein ABT56_18105 [Photobacterium aquae]